MNYEEYLRQNPEFAARQKAKEKIGQVQVAETPTGMYHCPNCGYDFDKPAAHPYGWGAFICGIVLSIIGGLFAITGIGIIIATPVLALATCAFIAFAVSYGIAAISPQKICPYCLWKHIVKKNEPNTHNDTTLEIKTINNKTEKGMNAVMIIITVIIIITALLLMAF